MQFWHPNDLLKTNRNNFLRQKIIMERERGGDGRESGREERERVRDEKESEKG